MWEKLKHLFKSSKTASSYSATSPDRRLVITWELKAGILYYSLKKDGRLIVAPSRIGFELQNDRPIANELQINRAHTRSVDETWETVWGEEREVKNHYNELSLYVSEQNGAERLFTVRCRIFDDGVAWRYEFPAQPNLQNFVITNEITEFCFDPNAFAWWIPSYQPDRYEYDYTKTPLFEMDKTVHSPLTLKLPTAHYVALHEAALYNYGAMNLKMIGNRLVSEITPLADGTRAHLVAPSVLPWRTLIVAHSAVDLLASRLMQNLNEPNVLKDTEWIYPAKYMGIWWTLHLGEHTWHLGERHGATTENAKRYIDACRKFGIPVLLIEGWNVGWDGDWYNNGSSFHFSEAYPDFNLAEVVAYGKQNGVEIMAHHETSGDVNNYEAQMADAYRFLEQNGIRYLKTGYAAHG